MGEPEFWNNSEKAQATVAELKGINSILKPLDEALGTSADLEALEELAREDGSLEADLATEADRLEKLVDRLELTSLLSGPHDSCDALVSIHARDGGTDANDWAEMLLRMYSAWASKHDYTVELLDRQDDAVAGIQSATVAIKGPSAYGYLKGEMGMHRLVRISPFNAEGKRQTSFAAVDVAPEIDDDDSEVEIRDEDIREDVFRASGAGGQHVNVTDSAVRITHIPSGVVVAVQDERSQHKNKAKALKLLRTRLFDAERERLANTRSADRKAMVGSGDRSERIRTYNFPQGRVTDHRINLTLHRLPEILAGSGLDELVTALIAEDEAARLASLG